MEKKHCEDCKWDRLEGCEEPCYSCNWDNNKFQSKEEVVEANKTIEETPIGKDFGNGKVEEVEEHLKEQDYPSLAKMLSSKEESNRSEAPMGASQWKNYGIRYGYDKYFNIVWGEKGEEELIPSGFTKSSSMGKTFSESAEKGEEREGIFDYEDEASKQPATKKEVAELEKYYGELEATFERNIEQVVEQSDKQIADLKKNLLEIFEDLSDRIVELEMTYVRGEHCSRDWEIDREKTGKYGEISNILNK